MAKGAQLRILTGATATVSTLATVVGHPNTPNITMKKGINTDDSYDDVTMVMLMMTMMMLPW